MTGLKRRLLLRDGLRRAVDLVVFFFFFFVDLAWDLAFFFGVAFFLGCDVP